MTKFIKQQNVTSTLNFLRFAHSADGQVLLIVFTDLLVIVKQPVLYGLVPIQTFDVLNTDLEIVDSRSALLKSSATGFTQFVVNVPYNTHQIVSDTERWYAQTINAGVFQQWGQELGSVQYAQLIIVIDYIVNNVTQSQASILLSQDPRLLQDELSDSYSLDIMQAGLVNSIIQKFVQLSILQARPTSSSLNVKKLYHTCQYISSQNTSPIIAFIGEQLVEQFVGQYMQKFDIKYITNLLANYSLDDVEHSMYNLNFEEVYSTGVQLMAVEQLFRELNLRQK